MGQIIPAYLNWCVEQDTIFSKGLQQVLLNLES